MQFQEQHLDITIWKLCNLFSSSSISAINWSEMPVCMYPVRTVSRLCEPNTMSQRSQTLENILFLCKESIFDMCRQLPGIASSYIPANYLVWKKHTSPIRTQFTDDELNEVKGNGTNDGETGIRTTTASKSHTVLH